jgi:hypothetical protein
MLAYERIYAASRGRIESGLIDLVETPPGEGVEHWLHLHSASYDRMAGFSLELAERGGIDVEYCETPSTNLVTQRELEKAGGPQQLLRPFREAGGFECDRIDSDALRGQFPSLNPDYVGGITEPAGPLDRPARRIGGPSPAA